MKAISHPYMFALFTLLLAMTCMGCAAPQKTFAPPTYEFALPDTTKIIYCPAIKQDQRHEFDTCLAAPCSYGNVPVEGYPGACCAPGQTYSLEDASCIGHSEECPEGMESNKEGCLFEHPEDMIEVLGESCELSKNVSACYRLATYHALGYYFSYQYDRSIYFAEMACSQGHMASCAALASTHLSDINPDKRNEELARELYQLSCKAGVLRACKALIHIYEKWDDNLYKSLQIKQFMCDKLGSGCAVARALEARLLNQRDEDVILLDYYRKRCEKDGDINSCEQVVQESSERNVATPKDSFTRLKTNALMRCTEREQLRSCMFQLKKDIKTKNELSREIITVLDRLCVQDDHYQACEDLGLFLLGDKSKLKDETRAQREARHELGRQLAAKACEDGRRPISCVALAEHPTLEHDPDARERYLTRGCERGNTNACNEAGKIAHERYKISKDQRDVLVAHERFKRSCMGDHRGGCFELGRLHYHNKIASLSKKENYAESLAIFRYNCHESFDASSCYFLGGHYQYKKGVRFDQDLYENYTIKGCQHGNYHACIEVLVYVQGQPLELFQKIVRQSEEVVQEQRAFADGLHEEIAARINPVLLSPEEHLQSSLYALDEHVSKCKTFHNKKEDCDYARVRLSGLIKTAYKHYRLRCEEGDAQACYLRAMINYKRIGPIKAKPEKFIPYFARGCELGNVPACRISATISGMGLYDMPQDLVAARRLATLGCQSFQQTSRHTSRVPEHSCQMALMFGDLLEQSEEQVNPNLSSCDEVKEGYAFLCKKSLLAQLYRYASQSQRSSFYTSFMEEQCEARTLPGACTILARLLHDSDAARSAEVARSECERAKDPDCSEQARQLMLAPETFSTGFALLKTSCHEQDNIYACQDLATHLIKSPHLSEQAAGREALEKGCELKHATSCRLLGELYMGMGHITKDEEKASEFFKQSCELYDHEGCVLYRAHLSESW